MAGRVSFAPAPWSQCGPGPRQHAGALPKERPPLLCGFAGPPGDGHAARRRLAAFLRPRPNPLRRDARTRPRPGRPTIVSRLSPTDEVRLPPISPRQIPRSARGEAARGSNHLSRRPVRSPLGAWSFLRTPIVPLLLPHNPAVRAPHLALASSLLLNDLRGLVASKALVSDSMLHRAGPRAVTCYTTIVDPRRQCRAALRARPGCTTRVPHETLGLRPSSVRPPSRLSYATGPAGAPRPLHAPPGASRRRPRLPATSTAGSRVAGTAKPAPVVRSSRVFHPASPLRARSSDPPEGVT